MLYGTTTFIDNNNIVLLPLMLKIWQDKRLITTKHMLQDKFGLKEEQMPPGITYDQMVENCWDQRVREDRARHYKIGEAVSKW